MYEELPKRLYDYIQAGESTVVEFKKSSDRLPNSLFESICSMLNRNGGHIFLGIDDNKNVVGVSDNCVDSIKRDFANLCNNQEKIKPTVHLEAKPYLLNNKVILYINVYESSDVHMTANRIYDRTEDGDYDITGNTSLIAKLYFRKSNTYFENKVYPYATMDDLRTDLISRVRQMAVNRVANHPWGAMSDLELLKSASLYEKDYQSGVEGFNLACILLFGKDSTISSVLSYYKTDALLRINDFDRYDDRDEIKTNLIESYDRLISFIQKHTDEKFYLEGNQRLNIRDIIARELCVNLLVHREYSNPTPTRLIITKDSIVSENANKPRSIGYIDLNNYMPYPKNPKIANVFKEIGLAEELGSGIKKISKYIKAYSDISPTFKDNDVFEVYIPLANKNIVYNNIKLDGIKLEIYEFIMNGDGVSRQEINEFIVKRHEKMENSKLINKCDYAIRFLREQQLICNIGTDSKPNWVAPRG